MPRTSKNEERVFFGNQSFPWSCHVRPSLGIALSVCSSLQPNRHLPPSTTRPVFTGFCTLLICAGSEKGAEQRKCVQFASHILCKESIWDSGKWCSLVWRRHCRRAPLPPLFSRLLYSRKWQCSFGKGSAMVNGLVERIFTVFFHSLSSAVTIFLSSFSCIILYSINQESCANSWRNCHTAPIPPSLATRRFVRRVKEGPSVCESNQLVKRLFSLVRPHSFLCPPPLPANLSFVWPISAVRHILHLHSFDPSIFVAS